MDARWVLIGDVVGSRNHPDRAALQRRLGEALAWTAAQVPTDHPPTVTVGDEFQAAYPTRADAFEASFWLHVCLLVDVRIRIGIGHGEITVDDGRFPLGQDGPAWWVARDALAVVEAGEAKSGARWTAAAGHDDPLATPYLIARDLVLRGLDGVDGLILRRLVAGVTQRDIADELGINPSSVSRRIRERGLRELLEARR